jgi:ribA/ribD-fused uncharacterized protein
MFSNGFSLLSNLHYTPFFVDNVRYSSLEQFIYAQMALSAKDYFAHQSIMTERSSRRYRELRINGLDFNEWRRCFKATLQRGLEQKFTQCQAAKEKLLSTGDATIVYATKYDRVLGSGFPIEDERNMDRDAWEGLNELGNHLMSMRSQLKKL